VTMLEDHAVRFIWQQKAGLTGQQQRLEQRWLNVADHSMTL